MTAADQRKTKAELMKELVRLRRGLSRLEKRIERLTRERESLRETEELYHNLINNLPVGLFRNTPGPTGKFIMANPAIARMFGCQRVEDFLHYSVAELYQDPGERKKFSEKLLARGSVAGEELRLKRIDGATLWGSVSARGIRDEHGRIKYFDGLIEDITQRKRTENALQESEEQFRALFERSRDALMILDRKGFMDCNGATLSLFGFSTREEFVAKHPGEISPPLQPDGEPSDAAARARIETAYRDGSHFFEWDHQRRDGSTFHANVLLSRFELRGREVLQATVRDITASKRVEEELKASRHRLADIINFLPDAAFVINGEGKVTAWNRAIEEMTGIAAEDMLGKGDYEYALPFYGERRPLLINLAGEPVEEVSRKYQNVRRQGETLYGEGFVPLLRGGMWFAGSAAPLRDAAGKVTGAIETFRDVTEYRRLMEELEDSQRRLADIIAFLPDPTMVIDAAGRVTAWNRAIEEMTGVKAEDMLGKGDHEYAVPFYGERRPILVDLVLRPEQEIGPEYSHLHRQGDVITGQGHITNLGGGDLYFVGSAISLRDSAGKVEGAIETIRDVTERKRFEDELALARDAAETANRSKSAFLANMSHEIRTPMNAIIGMGEILADTELSDEQRSYTEIVISSAASLLNIINDILDFSKIEAGKMDLSPRPFDFRRLVEELGQLFAMRIDQKKIDLIVNYEPGTPEEVIGDEIRLRQVITNLLSNAAKFTSQGHILVEVSCPHRDEKQAELLVRVEDSGIGVPEEARQLIFDKFTQVDSSPRRRFEGTGLGLAITKQLIALMGGSLGVESEVGRGSAFFFTVTLPLSEEVKEPLRFSANLSGLRVLVVDDNKVNRMVIRKQLASSDLAADDTASPQEAIGMLQEGARAGRPYDFALLDFQMPEMDGIQLAEAIKKEPGLDHTVLIMLFSVLHQSDLDYLQRLGLAACLTKPLRTRLLLETMSTVWSARINHQKIKMIVLHRPTFEDYRTEAARPLPQYSSSHVLLAEDNLANQKVAAKLLQNLGCEVEIAGDGHEAVKLAAAREFDLIFMDCQMPGMDGFEAARRIRAREPAQRHTPIIALTAYAMQGDRERCLQAGMDDYITKPISRHRVREALERFLTAGQEPPRLKIDKVLVADGDKNEQQLLSSGLRRVFPGARIKMCDEGFRMASWLSGFLPDLLVLDAAIPNVNSAAVISYLRQEERFAKTKILLITPPPGTASPVSGENLARGVDGAVEKPLSPERVEEVLRHLAGAVPGMTGPGADPAPPAAAGEDAVPVMDYTVLDNITDGDPEFAAEIIGHYRSSLPGDVKKIQDALAADDVLAVGKAAHGVKGAAANVGARRLQDLAGHLEAAARRGEIQECREMGRSLSPLLEEFIRELEKGGDK